MCLHESSRLDKFLDVPLVIRPFGENRILHSVHEALSKFVQTEILEGDNAYMCDRCQKKVTAKKGLKFLKFPYLLALQLKRFDFDPETVRFLASYPITNTLPVPARKAQRPSRVPTRARPRTVPRGRCSRSSG